MSHGGEKSLKKCHILFEWPLNVLMAVFSECVTTVVVVVKEASVN